MKTAWNYVEIKPGTRFGQLTVLEEISTDNRLKNDFKTPEGEEMCRNF